MGSMTRVKVDRTKTVDAAAAAWGSCGADQIGFFVGAKVAADPRNAATLKEVATRVGEINTAIGRRPPEGQLTVITFRPGCNAIDKGYTVSHEWPDAAVDEGTLAIVIGRDVFLRLALVDGVSLGAKPNPTYPSRASDQGLAGRITLLEAALA